MRLIAITLIGGAALGFLGAYLVQPEVAKRILDVNTQMIVYGAVTGFLGGVWGWVGKGVFGAKTRE